MINEENKKELMEKLRADKGIRYIPGAVLIVLAVVIYATQLGFVLQHENVHKAIYSHYGIASDIDINYYSMSGYTRTSGEQYHELCNETCKSLHIQNEIISYNIDAILNAIYLVSIVIIGIGLLIFIQLKVLNKVLFYS